MSSEKEYKAADLRGPFNAFSAVPFVGQPNGGTKAEIVAINIAGTTSTSYDLASSTYFNGDHYQDRFVRIISESAGNFWYYWSSVNGDTVDKTATGQGATVAGYWPSATPLDEMPGGRYLVIQAQQAWLIRVWISNRTR